MRHYIKGVLSLWTVLTTIWTLLSFGLFAGLVKAYSEKEKERTQRHNGYVSYRSYRDSHK